MMNQMMQAVVTNGTGRAAASTSPRVVGKTGTSSSYRDAWFVGFTGALVTGVWVGYDDFRPMPGITGGSLPAQAWHSYMSVAHKNYRDHSADPGPAAASQPGGRAAAAQRAQAHGPGHGAGPDGPGRAEGAASCPTRPGRAEEGRRDHAPGRRAATDARQRAPASATPPGTARRTGTRPPEPKAKPPAAAPDRRAEVPGAASGHGPDGGRRGVAA